MARPQADPIPHTAHPLLAVSSLSCYVDALETLVGRGTVQIKRQHID